MAGNSYSVSHMSGVLGIALDANGHVKDMRVIKSLSRRIDAAAMDAACLKNLRWSDGNRNAGTETLRLVLVFSSCDVPSFMAGRDSFLHSLPRFSGCTRNSEQNRPAAAGLKSKTWLNITKLSKWRFGMQLRCNRDSELDTETLGAIPSLGGTRVTTRRKATGRDSLTFWMKPHSSALY